MRIAKLITLATAAVMTAAPAYAQGRGGGHPNPPATVHGNPHEATPNSTPASTPPANTAPHLNPIAQKISANPQLSGRLTTLLPAGMTLDQASAGFRNQGQFIAALHVSHNLNIPFRELKSAMLGTTAGAASAKPLSLGQAIHKLRPGVDADNEAKQATSEAEVEISAKASTTTTRR